MIERDLEKRRKKGGMSEHLQTSLFEQEKTTTYNNSNELRKRKK